MAGNARRCWNLSGWRSMASEAARRTVRFQHGITNHMIGRSATEGDKASLLAGEAFYIAAVDLLPHVLDTPRCGNRGAVWPG